MGEIKSYKCFGDLAKLKILWHFEMFFTTGPYGAENVKNATPSVFIPSEPNVIINKAAIRLYKVINVLAICQNSKFCGTLNF